MATILNNRSNIATDPIRNFRFLVTFIPHGNTVTTQQVTTGANGAKTPVTTAGGTAGTGWKQALASIPFGFTSVTGLAVQTDSIPYREGGYNTTVHQIPGQTAFAPITMGRGVILGSSQNWNWMRELFQTVQGTQTRSTADNFRCDIEIAVLSHPMASTSTGALKDANGNIVTSGVAATEEDHVSMRFKVYNAWITSLAYSDLNAGDNAILVEQMSLVHEGFDVIFGTGISNAGSAKNFTY